MNISNKNVDNTKRAAAPPPQDKKAAQKAAPKAPSKVTSADTQPMDTVEISAAGKDKPVDMQAMLDEMRAECRSILEGIRNAQEAGEGMAETMKVMLRCLKIAMRIMMGDNVPPQDERYLAENDIELYSRAMQLRIQKVDPEDYDSLLDDDEDGVGSAAEEPENGGAGPVAGSSPSDAGGSPDAAAVSSRIIAVA